MGMHQVHNHGNPHAVSGIDQRLEFLRCPKPRRGSKKVGHMVTKRAVVRVLHHRHQLNGSIARGMDAREDVLFKFKIGPYPLFFLRHPHMTLVNEGHGCRFIQWKFLIRPWKWVLRKPELSGKILAFLVLHHATNVGRNTIQVAVVGADHPNLQFTAMNKGILILSLGQEDLPIPSAISSKGVGSSVPTVEIPDQVQGFGMGSPFSVGPTFANGINLDAVIFVATCKFSDTARIVGNGTVCRLETGTTPLDYLPIGLQPRFLF